MSATTKDVAQVKRGTSFLRLKRDHVKKDRPSSKDAPGDAATTPPTSPSSAASSSSSSLPAVPEDPAPDGEIVGPAGGGGGGGGDGSVGRAGGVGLVEQLLAEADQKRFKLREVEDKRASMMGSMAPISLRDPPPTRFASSDALPPPSATTTSPSPSSSSSPRSTSLSNLSGAAGDRHTFVRSPFADAGRHVAPGPGAGAPALPPKRVGGGVAHSLPSMTSVAALKQQPSPRSNNGLHHPEIDSATAAAAATTTTTTTATATATRSSSPGSSPRVSPLPSSSEAAASSLASSQSLLVSSPRSGEAVDPVLQQQRLRQQVVEELVNTETDYVRDLKLILSVFYMPLKSRGILGNAELQSIFSNLSVLLNVNEQLERALADMRAQKDDKVGHIFLETADYFKMYTQYCANQENCIRTMDLLEKKNKPFAKFLDECAENPATRSLSFNAFLIKPIQRICKYPLLLRELLKYTPEEHPDYAQAKAALEKVQGVVEEVNKKKRDSENLQKILEIQGQISNISELGQSLVKPGRQFLREMTCSKVSSQGKTQERHLFLFSDLLVFASSTLFQQKISDFKSTIKGKASVSNSRKIYLYKSAIPLKRCSAWSIPDTDTAQHGFEILLMDGDKKIVTLYCKTADEKDEWLAHMTERVKFYQDKANSKKKQDGAAGTVKLASAAPSALSQSHIPVVPDDPSSSSSLSAPLPRPKKITGTPPPRTLRPFPPPNLIMSGKTRTRLPTQMFEGADLVLTGDDQQPASPRSGSSSPSSASASPAGSLIGGMVGHDDAPATTMVGPFVVASSSSQSVAVRPLLSSGSLIVSGSHAVLPNTVSSRDPTEAADAVLCDLQSSSSTSRSRKDRRAPVLLEKRSLDVEMERIEASSSHDHIEPVPDHAAPASLTEPRQPLSRGGSGIVPAADGPNRLRGNTLEPGAGAAALPSPSSADGASPRGTTASDLVSPRRATLSTATAVPPLRPSSGTLSADNGPTPSPGSGGSSSAARSPRRTFSCHPSPAPSDPAAAAAASTTAAAAGPPPSSAATPSPGSGGPSSTAAGRGPAPPPPSTASKPRFTMASGGKPPVVGTTNPLPLAALGPMAEPTPSPSSSSPPPSGDSSSTSASPSSLSPSSSTPAAAVGSPGDAGFRSRVSYYTPNPITDDASTTTSRATRPRGGPRGRGRG